MEFPPPLPSSTRKQHAALLFVTVLVIVAALALLAFRAFQPRWYFAQVTWQIAPSEENGARFSPGDPLGQVQTLRRTEVLHPVIDMLKLTQGYVRDSVATREETYNELVHSMRVDVPPGQPQIVHVGVYDRDPNRAANIANTVAVVYRNKRMEDLQSALDRSLSQYVGEVEKLRATVATNAEEMRRIGARDQVTDPSPDRVDAPLAGGETGAYLAAKTRNLQARQILEKAEVALCKARLAAAVDEQPVHILEKAVPPARPVSSWRGDPRTWTGL